jgi:hypothetical protein
MRVIEHAVDVWDLRGGDSQLNSKELVEIRMALQESVDVQNLLADTETCGEAQGGPPHRSSLQYRPGEIVLYLPKRCLLDKKVAAS